MRFKSDEALMSWKKKDSSDIVVAIVSIKLESTVEYYPRSSAFTMIAIIDIVSPKRCSLPSKQPQRRQRQPLKTIGFMGKTTALHVHHTF